MPRRLTLILACCDTSTALLARLLVLVPLRMPVALLPPPPPPLLLVLLVALLLLPSVLRNMLLLPLTLVALVVDVARAVSAPQRNAVLAASVQQARANAT